jgi:anaerobic magnesium-protoporphyrin IX monomethyl ester cyclase
MVQTGHDVKVLVITGGLLSGVEPSLTSSVRKALQQWLASEHAWLDVKIKLAFAEFLIHRPRATNQELWAPDLTEVLLATLLKREGMPYALATCSDLFDKPAIVDRLLSETDCVLFLRPFCAT